MSRITLAGRGAVVACVLAALVIPAAALAGPGQGDLHARLASRPATAVLASTGVPPAVGKPTTVGQRPAGAASSQGQPAANLTARIENVLAARERRFGAASDAITAHITRVSALADKVQAAGGDVSEPRASLAEATTALATAKALEEKTATEFKSVPGSASKRTSLRNARTSGAKAVVQLKLARTKTVLAVHELRASVKSTRKPD